METEVSGRVTEDRVMAWTKGNLEVEIFSFVNDRWYLNLIIALRIILEKYLERRKDLYIACMKLKKVHDKVDRGGMLSTKRHTESSQKLS